MSHALSTLVGTFLAQEADAAIGGALILFYVALVVVYIVGLWKVYEKANQPGWAVLIPIYNIYVMLKIVGRPGWWLLLGLVPLVNLVVMIVVLVEVAQSFGKGVGFALGLVFLGPIFWMILGFGSARYVGPAAKSA